jgi:rhamnulose-1-phosphate aldolase
MIQTPYPEIDDLLEVMGEAGKRLSDIDASEGAAGNISVCLRWPIEPRSRFPLVEPFQLPQIVPELAGATFLVSGSGRRLREIIDEPSANIGCIVVDEGGKTAKLYISHHCRFERVTSEFNSHLAVHYDQILSSGTNFHAVIHAQPPHLTYLSHVPRYQDETYLNTHLLMAHTVESLRKHRIVVWAKHGVMARSDLSVKRAADRVEYAETAAKYEYLNLSVGEIGEGLSVEEIRAICKTLTVSQNIF